LFQITIDPKAAADRTPIDSGGLEIELRSIGPYYLSYCEAGFLEGVIDVGMYCLERAPQLNRALSMSGDPLRLRA
jgi:hypothetical protein